MNLDKQQTDLRLLSTPPHPQEGFNNFAWGDGASSSNGFGFDDSSFHDNLGNAMDFLEPLDPDTRSSSVATIEIMEKSKTRPFVKVSRRPKKPKGKPRRSLTAYNLFFRDVRSELLAEPGHVTFEQMGKIVGSRWQVLPAEERAKYEGLAKEDTLRYQTEMKLFEENRKKEQETRASQRFVSNLPLESTLGLESLLPSHCKLQNLPSEWLDDNIEESGSPFPIAPGTEVKIAQSDGSERRYKVEYKFVTMKQHEAKQFMSALNDRSQRK